VVKEKLEAKAEIKVSSKHKARTGVGQKGGETAVTTR
jgi:hypothetical protein